jgi:hypothetical protein
MDDETPSDPSSPLDDLFVAGARYHEPSAQEREQQAKEFQRRGKEAAKANAKARKKAEKEAKRRRSDSEDEYEAAIGSPSRRWVPWVIFAGAVALAWYMLGGGGGDDDGGDVDTSTDTQAQITPTEDARPTEARLMYASTPDAPADANYEDAIRHEVDIANDWLDEQTGGQRIRMVETNGVVDYEEAELDSTSAELAERSDAYNFVAEELGLPTEGYLDEITIVFVPVTFDTQERCGEGSESGLVVIWIGTCDLQPSVDSSWPSTASFTVAHELMHALGAVDNCAPHYGHNGHVVDDPNDLMFDGDRTEEPVFALDPGHDDYFEHDMLNCADVSDHPAWVDSTS